MKKYDVGIFGLWYGNNYGSIITYYALSKVVESMGLTFAMIRNPLGRDLDIDSLDRSHPLRFAKEKYDVTPLIHLNGMNKLNEYFDKFLLGSDQMWNYYLSKPYRQSYFLDFVDDDKIKVSYATSFGLDVYIGPEEEKIITKKNLQRFDAVSVRDDFSKRICENDFNVKAELVLDPVFLCPLNEYETLIEEASKDFKIEEEFIFAYILDPNEELGKSICAISEETGKKIIVVFNQINDLQFDKDRMNVDSENIVFKSSVTVKEWLYLLKKSEYVLTDSFHGTCFSILFNKKFISLKNNERGGSRFQFLLSTLGLLNRLINKPSEFVSKFHEFGLDSIWDYTSVNNILNKERERCYNWLKNILISSKKSDNKINHNDFILDTKSGSHNIRNNSIEAYKVNCTGCSVCSSVCPKSAIRIIENSEGFLTPVVNKDLCINCGLCVKKCIDLNPFYVNNKEPKCYAMMADEDIRKNSSSGGMFSVAAEYIISKGGYVCGAAYREDFSVEHIIIDKSEDLYKLRGSKYMQSHIGNTYIEIKKLLDSGKDVLFTGMPCQVAGLHSYLGKEYDKLISIDLLCHGITSSKVFEKYHRDVLNYKELKRLEFKEKQPWGWHAGINAYFSDGSKYQKPHESDLYFIAYLNSISKNTTCEVCKANRLPRQADLSIGDFWGISKADPEMFDNMGTSAVLINNEKGKIFFDLIKDRMAKYKEEPLNVAIKGNRIIEKPYKLNKNRNLFFQYFDKLSFQSLTLGCYNNNLYEYMFKEIFSKMTYEEQKYYYLAKTAAKYANGRKIVTWIRNNLFEQILSRYFGLTVAFGLTQRKEAVKEGKILDFEIIKGKSDEFYLVSLDRKYDKDIYMKLNNYGYNEFKDFVFKVPKPKIIENYDLSLGSYFDEYGNTIEGSSGIIKKVIFKGMNSHITIGKSVRGVENIIFDLCSDSKIKIEESSIILRDLAIQTIGLIGNSELTIKRNCRITNGLIRIYNHVRTSSIMINEKCTFETNLEIHANSGKKIIIGRDCMFSHDIDLWAGDGHTIFDIKTGKNMNSNYDDLPDYKNKIIIGEHVWVAKGAFIMHGTSIGNGSIIGARSVVKGKYPNNCTIAGNPAKLVKCNVVWSREMVATDSIEQYVEEKYILLTEV